MVRLLCSFPCTGSTSSSLFSPHIFWTTAGKADHLLKHIQTHAHTWTDSSHCNTCSHPFWRVHSCTTLTHRHVNTHTTACVLVTRWALWLKPCCKSADTHVHTFSHPFFDLFSRFLSWCTFSGVAPQHNERPGSPCSIFHASASSTLSSS